MQTTAGWRRQAWRAGVVLLWAAGLAWSLPLLHQAQQRWRYERVSVMARGPFIPAELLADHRRSSDWRTPLLEATLPLAAVGALTALRSLRRRRAA